MERILLVLRCIMILQKMTVLSGRGSHVVNIALHKPAKQSSNYEGHPPNAGRAVDGKLNTFFQACECSHTSTKRNRDESGSNWWEVDLESHYIIGYVRILNRDFYRQCILVNSVGEEEVVMARSTLNCAVLTGATAGYTGFKVTEMGEIRWKIIPVPTGYRRPRTRVFYLHRT